MSETETPKTSLDRHLGQKELSFPCSGSGHFRTEEHGDENSEMEIIPLRPLQTTPTAQRCHSETLRDN